tara:strand:+ start:324 stop:647 length:324 start_codon:yes stop_codon:yes gene_type:complete
MVRSELLQKLCNLYPSLIRSDIEKIVDIIFKEITNALYNGDDFEARGFGSFRVITRKARIGRNPKTGEKNIQIPEKKAIKWKTSKILFNKLNKNFTENNISDTYSNQ